MFELSSGCQFLGRSESFSIISWLQWTGGETNWQQVGRFIQTSPSNHQHVFLRKKSLLLFFLGKCNLYYVYVIVCVSLLMLPFLWGNNTGILKHTSTSSATRRLRCPAPSLAACLKLRDGWREACDCHERRAVCISVPGDSRFRDAIVLRTKLPGWMDDGWMTWLFGPNDFRRVSEFAKFRM